MNITTECVDPTSDDEAFVECNSFLDSSDRSNVTTPTSVLGSELLENDLSNDLNVTISVASPNTVCVEDKSEATPIAEQNHPSHDSSDIIPPTITNVANQDLTSAHLNFDVSMVETVDIEQAQEADASSTLPLDTTLAFITTDHTCSTNDTIGDTTEAMINLCSDTFEEIADSTVNIDQIPEPIVENSVLNETIQMSENAFNELNNRTVDEHIHQASEALSRSIDAMKSVSLIVQNNENIENAREREIDETVVNMTGDGTDDGSFRMVATLDNEANNILETVGINEVQSKETSHHSIEKSFSSVPNEIESSLSIEKANEANNKFASIEANIAQSQETLNQSKEASFSAISNEIKSTQPIEKAHEANNTFASIETIEAMPDEASHYSGDETFAAASNEIDNTLPIDQSNETQTFNSYEIKATMPSEVAKSIAIVDLATALNNDQKSPLVDQRINETIENDVFKSSPKDRALIPNAFNVPIKIVHSRRMSNGTGYPKTDESPRSASPVNTLNMTSGISASMDRSNANTILTGAARLDLHSAIDRLYTVPSNPNLNTTITTAIRVGSPTTNDRTINYDFNATHDIWPSTNNREEIIAEFSQNQAPLNHTFVGGSEVSTATGTDKSNSEIMGRKSILVRQDLFRSDTELENDYVEDMDVDMDFEQNVEYDNGAGATGGSDIDNYFDACAFKIPQNPTQARVPFVISDHHVPSTDGEFLFFIIFFLPFCLFSTVYSFVMLFFFPILRRYFCNLYDCDLPRCKFLQVQQM